MPKYYNMLDTDSDGKDLFDLAVELTKQEIRIVSMVKNNRDRYTGFSLIDKPPRSKAAEYSRAFTSLEARKILLRIKPETPWVRTRKRRDPQTGQYANILTEYIPTQEERKSSIAVIINPTYLRSFDKEYAKHLWALTDR